MQKIIAELCAVSASRQKQMRTIKEYAENTLQNGVNDMDDFLIRQRVRSQKQKTNLIILKKYKNIDLQTRQDILFMVLQMISNIDEQIGLKIHTEVYAGISEQETPQFGQLSINDLIQMIQKFGRQIKDDYQTKQCTCNNIKANILVDFVQLVSRVAKQKLKQAIFQMSEKNLKEKNVAKIEPVLKKQQKRFKLRKIQTQVSEENKYTNKIRLQTNLYNAKKITHTLKTEKNKQNKARETFEIQHQQYMHEKRRQFLGKFEVNSYQYRANQVYNQLRQLNLLNQNIIDKFICKCNGQKSPTIKLKSYQSDLYSQYQCKQKLQKITKQYEEFNNIQNMPNLNSTTNQIKVFRDLFITKSIEYNITKKRGTAKSDERAINSWLKIGLRVIKSLDYPIKLIILNQKCKRQGTDIQIQSFPQIITDKLPPSRPSLGFNSATSSVNYPSKFRRQITGCFSRKKIKELLQGPRISPTKKHTIAFVQKSNTTLTLPYLPSSGSTVKLNKDDVDKKRKITEDSNMLRDILQKKIQSNPQNSQKYDIMKQGNHKKEAINQSYSKLPCSVIEFEGA